MAKGDKPSIRISARRKDAPKGSRESVEVMAGWTGDYGINIVLDKGVREIVMMDGTIISGATHWINGRTFSSGAVERLTTRGTEEGTGTAPPMKDPNDIPF